ncbi:sugar phosphate isomerase/epimerase family protein [Alicyclobacillus fodiniaquatilis]|jgi:sugar phosphate isomerase/epimerase|uniref:Sugar phosphate isomerase/epimerase family protein n=1 Tax=Alicyclobacillus fodiniaquatilis TaxID=1661150 RepID=A0ABW4JLR1_9BACL
MKACLHPSIVAVRELVPYLDLAHSIGYEYVDVDGSWLAKEAESHGEAALDELFAARSLKLGSFGLPVNLFGSEADFESGLSRLEAEAERAIRLGGTRCCTFLWPSIDELPVPYASRLASRLRRCANILAAYGVRLGLEFVGPHHLRNKKYPFVVTLADALAYIEGIGAPNVGILLDSYHAYTAEVPLSEVSALKGHQIVHVHVNDTPQPPHLAHDFERVLPGEGAIDLAGFFQALGETGYNGPVSLEVLNKEPIGDAENTAAKKAFAAVEGYIQAAREGASARA